MDVFDVFDLSDYTFLEISRGGVEGNVILNQIAAEGVFKLRGGMNSLNNQETTESDATLHVKPDESFADTGFIGHGIRCQGKDYEIVGVTGGDNFDSGEREHYRLTLKRADFAEIEESS